MAGLGTRCDGCGASHYQLVPCIACLGHFCPFCASVARQCGGCAAKERVTAAACSFCDDRNNKIYACMACSTTVCGSCSRRPPNRPNTVLCKMCEAKLPPATPCSRCTCIADDINTIDYCELCANPLCAECLPFCFESGVLKCSSCCPVPLRLAGDRAIREYLLDKFRIILSPPIPPAPTAPTAAPCQSRYAQLRRLKKLGEGAQGVVYKCETADGEVVVTKEMTFSPGDRRFYETRLKRAKKMLDISHEHIIRYLEVVGCGDPPKITIVMPYYSEGDLFNFIKRQNTAIGEQKLCSLSLQIATALRCLHSQRPPLVHCDIKPENVLLLNKEEQVLLMDLDLCRSFEARSDATDSERGPMDSSPTFEYRAPELTRTSGSPKCDIFSLGVLMFVLATLPEFVMLRNSKGVMSVLSDRDWTSSSLSKAIRDAINCRSRGYSEKLIDLIIGMLNHNPSARPGAEEVVEKLTRVMESLLLSV
ncbi:Protein kinase domain [Trypanosoma vivax]|uniref:Protein kinase domain-containing protein n=1 Tax=Trypanosoma vivax (strain Y486) TaxID=1055687 RepID=G0TSZ9_TRYVY|nr:Protein kinase domain [Trypanosoma vivax]CCC47079.1 putative protein kinase [Trypanosoma vivax Y486]